MHNVYRLPDPMPHAVGHLSTEVDVAATARQLAATIASNRVKQATGRTDADRDRCLRLAGKAGLFGISVPSEFGGADIANAVVAETVALIAASDARLAHDLSGHFQVLEALRLAGSDTQSTRWFSLALSGEPILLIGNLQRTPEGYETWPVLSAARSGFLIPATALQRHESATCSIAVGCLDPIGQPVIVLMEPLVFDPTIESLAVGAVDGGAHIALPASNVFALPQGPEDRSTLDALGELLQAAIDLGVARALFGRLCLQRSNGDQANSGRRRTVASAGDLEKVGRFAARLDGASALVERAGQHLDMAQVNGTADLILQAGMSAGAAAVLTSDVLEDLLYVSYLDDERAADGVLEPAHRPTQARSPARTGLSSRDSGRLLGALHLKGTVPDRWPFAY